MVSISVKFKIVINTMISGIILSLLIFTAYMVGGYVATRKP